MFKFYTCSAFRAPSLIPFPLYDILKIYIYKDVLKIKITNNKHDSSTLETMSTCSLLCYRSHGLSGFTYNQKTRECRLVSGWFEFQLPVREQVLTTQAEDKLILNGKFYRTGRFGI